MNDDTRASRARLDNLETDPAKKELFHQLHQIDALVRAHGGALPIAASLQLDAAIMRALEAVRSLPSRPQ